MPRKSDYYTQEAKRLGYPARSVFKLKEIQAKYRILKKGDRILDLGAAPGSWSKFALETVGSHGRVAAVDLTAIHIDVRRPAAGQKYHAGQLITLEGDILSEEMETVIAAQAPFDVVLSDVAPATSGNRFTDAYRSFELAERVTEYGTKFLRPGGNLVLKIFQGGDEGEILRRMKSLFRTAKAFKPQSSRNESFETFFIGRNRRKENE